MSSSRLGGKPRRENLSWPGLRARDHLSRVVTQWVKERNEGEENEDWARHQIARVLDWVPPETVMKLLYREARRRNKSIPMSPSFVASRLIAPKSAWA